MLWEAALWLFLHLKIIRQLKIAKKHDEDYRRIPQDPQQFLLFVIFLLQIQ